MKRPTITTHQHYQRGASLIEYALLVALIAMIAIPAIYGVGRGTRNTFEDSRNKLAGATIHQPPASDE